MSVRFEHTIFCKPSQYSNPLNYDVSLFSKDSTVLPVFVKAFFFTAYQNPPKIQQKRYSAVAFSEEEKLNRLISSECLNSYQEPDKMQTRPKPGSDCPISMASTPWRGLCADNRNSVTTK